MIKNTKNKLESKVKFEIEFTVRAHQVDHKKQLKPIALGDMLIVISQEHSLSMDLGVDTLLKQGVSWVLGRMTFEIDEWPKYLDKIKINTWISHVGKYKSVRTYTLENKGVEVGRAYTLWSLFNLRTRRPMKLSTVEYLSELALEISNFELEDKVQRLEVSGDLIKEGEFEVMYSDTDILNHMYSIKYLEHAMDIIGYEFIEGSDMSFISMNFVRETGLGNKVTTKLYSNDNNRYVVFNNHDNGKMNYICQFT